MKQGKRTLGIWLGLGLALGFALPASAQGDGDLFLFTAAVPPNVVILMDNSRSMKHIEWHPAFDQTVDPTVGPGGCADWDNDTVYEFNNKLTNQNHCGNTRDIWSPDKPTLWQGRYLNWYFSDAADPHYSAATGCTSNCILDAMQTATCNPVAQAGAYQKYRRTRADAAKVTVLEVICEAEAKGVRFGLAEYRLPEDAADEDPNGGFISVAVDKHSNKHQNDLEAHVGNSSGDASSPLGESLFQIYTYFMSRDPADLPVGQDTVTKFPAYEYKTNSNGSWAPAQAPESPIQNTCQKNFVILVTDGAPSRDDFDQDPMSTAQGFANLGALIGNYNPDAEVEAPPLDPEEAAYWVDDIAKFMAENDCRPDLDGDQPVDVYTVGFGSSPAANLVLEKTADVGNGIFFYAQDGEQLGTALLLALNDIIEKAQSFTNVTVPSTRTADGGDFYTSFFIPSGKSAFWEGHLMAWHLAGSGDVLDADGNCALIDPDPGECNSGPFKAEANPFWDAASEMPLPAARNLFTSKLVAGTPTRVPFDATLNAADLSVAPFAAPPDPAPNSALYPFAGSTALNEEGLADEIVEFVRGCEFGTGVALNVATPAACLERERTLGDVFHSNPVVVKQPHALNPEASYQAFKTTHANRKRVIYVGSNGGFLHAFDAGDWDAMAVPPAFTPGTGEELFAFMPWQARRAVRSLPVDDPLGRQLYVDGQLGLADAWFHPTPTTGTKAAGGNEWHTVLVGGMRQGGSQYFALDVTDPEAVGAPVYLWEFPREDDPNDPANPNSFLPWMGETWGRPVITKVRVKVGADDNGGQGYERWVAIVTAGYHATSDPNDNLNYDATARMGRAIYVLDLKTGEVLAEVKHDAAAADDTQYMEYAIPATPGVFDLNYDGFADVVYVGDLGGNLFKWVISDVGEDRVNDGSGSYTQPAWTFRRIFEAPPATVGGVTYYKSFFFPPAGTFAGNKFWLAFGSGERTNIELLGDASSDAENNRLYVITDPDPFEKSMVPFPSLSEADLQDFTLLPGGAPVSGRGYYFRGDDGEKFVTNVTAFAGFVIAASFTPIDSPLDLCTSKGFSKLYVFKVTNGAGHYDDGAGNPLRAIDIGSGMPTDPQISVGIGDATTRVYVGKSGADLESPDGDFGADEILRLLYWRELP